MPIDINPIGCFPFNRWGGARRVNAGPGEGARWKYDETKCSSAEIDSYRHGVTFSTHSTRPVSLTGTSQVGKGGRWRVRTPTHERYHQGTNESMLRDKHTPRERGADKCTTIGNDHASYRYISYCRLNVYCYFEHETREETRTMLSIGDSRLTWNTNSAHQP